MRPLLSFFRSLVQDVTSALSCSHTDWSWRWPKLRRMNALLLTCFRELPDKIRHGVVALVLIFLSQLLIWGLDCLLVRMGVVFPSCIVGMLLLFVCVGMLNRRYPQVEQFYNAHLKAPVCMLPSHLEWRE